ncbi:MAG: preprotein translocase subunit SecG [Verrucomicrobiales bacterium]|jgi:preprotein translocase subunit SecG
MDFLAIFFNVLVFLHVLVSILLGLIILMQRPKQEGLGAAFAGGMMNESFGAQTTDVLQKATRFLAICFFTLAALMAVVKSLENRDNVLSSSTGDELAAAAAAAEAEKSEEPEGLTTNTPGTPEQGLIDAGEATTPPADPATPPADPATPPADPATPPADPAPAPANPNP